MSDDGQQRPLYPEGEPAKPWVVWRVGTEGQRIERVAEADTREELAARYKRRLDWRYKIYHQGKPVD
ncbi:MULTISPECIES: hypothetical protein [unclassified Bradyrhizobium]|uniref:hypothetical protein n=1 Tax=unclassified Bradyrhizobium TaxID=2631580 RepID=UPI0028EDC87D|nr:MULTISPECIES: hypothetical protein [unclassified Bradyrhizobium]